MQINLYPCLKVAKGTQFQWYLKLPSELAEVQRAVIDLETGLFTCCTAGARETLRNHLAEEIVDLMTAAATLAELYRLDLHKAADAVRIKNHVRGYL